MNWFSSYFSPQQTKPNFVPEGAPLPQPEGEIIDYEMYMFTRRNDNRHRWVKAYKFTKDWPYLENELNRRLYKYRSDHIVFLKPDECVEKSNPNRSCIDVEKLINSFQQKSHSKRRGSFTIPIPTVYSNSTDEEKIHFIEACIASKYYTYMVANPSYGGGKRKTRKARKSRKSRRN